jgi:hypothetical protein
MKTVQELMSFNAFNFSYAYTKENAHYYIRSTDSRVMRVLAGDLTVEKFALMVKYSLNNIG